VNTNDVAPADSGAARSATSMLVCEDEMSSVSKPPVEKSPRPA